MLVLSATPPGANNELFAYFYVMFLPNVFSFINLYLMFFNLLPIPPLDGSSIFAILLPPKYLPKYYQIQQYAFPVFMIAIVVLPYVFNFNPFGMVSGGDGRQSVRFHVLLFLLRDGAAHVVQGPHRQLRWAPSTCCFTW